MADITPTGLLTSFRASFYAAWFVETPDTIINPAIAEIVSHRESKIILNKCSTIYTRYVVLSAMLLIHNSGLYEDTGTIVAPSLDSVSNLIVQQDLVADTSRKFFKPEKVADGDGGVLSRIRKEVSDIERRCVHDGKKSMMYGIAGGSNYKRNHNSSSDGCVDGKGDVVMSTITDEFE